MKLEKVNNKRKSVHVADQILKSASSGEIKPGDRLPSENELAEMIGVSRSSVREALAALRLAEIVETRAGDGTYLKNVPSHNDIQERIFKTLTQNQKPLQLQEARAAFECGIMKYVVEKADDNDITNIKEVIEYMKKAAEKDDYESFIDYHKKFHLALAQSTKNVIIQETVATFKEIMDQRIWKDLEKIYYLPEKKEYLVESVSVHSIILEAITNRNEKKATESMMRHFERYS